MGLNDQDTISKKKSTQPYGYDSGLTVPQNYNVEPEFHRTEGGDELNNDCDAKSNDIESENTEYDDTVHKSIYQKETKIIERRETVDPAVINRDQNYVQLEKSNSDKNLDEKDRTKPEVII